MDNFHPRRLRLIQESFVHYTGPIGFVDFVDGVSTAPIAWEEASRIGSIVLIEDADDPGYQIGPSADLTRNRDRTVEDPLIGQVDRGEHVNGEGAPVIRRYSRTDLEEIGDKNGLAGVRTIANQWGVTGRSINDCIIAVLSAQDKSNVIAS